MTGETIKGPSEIAKKTAGGKPEQPPPPEAPPQPPPEAEVQTMAEQVAEKTASAKVSELVEVTKEQAERLAAKLKEAIPAAARRIIGEEGEQIKDARVFSIIEELIGADETRLADPAYMRRIGEKLVGIVRETGYLSPPGQEARKYLNRIVAEHPSLEDLRYKAMPEIAGGSGLPEETGAEKEPAEAPPETEFEKEIRQLYDEAVDVELKATPFVEDLKSLQYRLRVDRGAILDSERLIDETIKKIVEKGQREGVAEELVREAIRRVRHLERRIAETTEEISGRGIIRWHEVKPYAPESVVHDDRETFNFRDITREEVEVLKRGPEGEAKWYFDFIDQIYSLGREESRPDLPQTMKFQEFKDYLVWKYGSEYHLAVQLYQKHWDSRGMFEYAVKGMMYNPGDVKDRLKAMSLLQAADLDHLYKNFDHSNIAATFYEHVLFEKMAEKRANYGRAVMFLRSNANDSVGQVLQELAGEGFSKEEAAKAADRIKKLLKDANKTTYEELLELLRSEQRKEFGGTQTPLSPLEQKLLHHIQAKIDLAAEGVMLWDDDVQSYTELHITLTKLDNARKEFLRKKAEGEVLTPKEAETMEEINRLYKIYSQREKMLNEDITTELLQTRGLSPVDIEVRKRLVEYLKSTGEFKNGEPPEYVVRMALWAARTAEIGSGRMAMIGAMMSIPPAKEYATASVKHIMRAPAFEDIQRIFNPEAFMQRFNVGAELGKTARHILLQKLLETKRMVKPSGWEKITSGVGNWWNTAILRREAGEAGDKLTHNKAWRTHKEGEHNKQLLAAMEAMEFAEDVTGISFSELLGPGFLATGGFYDGTTWRLEKGIFDEWRQRILEMKKLPEGAALLDNQALSIQILTAKDASERRPILDRMLRRNPSKFLEMLEEDTERILAKNGVSTEEWRIFKEALSLAETKLAHDKKLQLARVDLAEETDFNNILAPYLTMLGIGEKRLGVMWQVLVDLQQEVYRKRRVEVVGGVVFDNKMDAVAHLKLPLTMSLTDFDWKESNFYQLGTVAMHRRIRDIASQMRARDGLLQFISNQDMLLSPNDPVETVKKFKEIRDAIIDYSGPDAAEATVKELARVFFEINRHRSLWTVGWIPGLTGLMKAIGEMDLRWAKNFKPFYWLVGGEKRWHELVEKRQIIHWPHSVSEAISYSVRYTGTHGNVWDEGKMDEILNTMHDYGIFIQHPEYVHDLRNEFRTRWTYRYPAAIRKYWFVVLAATVAMAVAKSVSEQEKSH